MAKNKKKMPHLTRCRKQIGEEFSKREVSRTKGFNLPGKTVVFV